MKRKHLIAAILATVVIAPLLAVVAVTYSFGRGDRICKGVTVSGIHIGGLSRSAAERAMREWARQRATQKVVLTAMDGRWASTLADLGGRTDWQEAVVRAYALGRKGSIASRVACVLTRGGAGKRIIAPVVIDRARLGRTLDKIAGSVNRPHRDARLRIVDGRIEVIQDSWGTTLDARAAPAVVAKALSAGEMIVALPVVPDKPTVTARDADGIDTLLAQYTTPFNPGRRDRTHNLTLAARAIDGTILKPGQEFSYNALVGPRELDTGYRNAPIFVRGKLEPGVGGGICQVSSTLYNAVLLTGLDVVERRPHSRVIPYAPAGRDATVAYGITDFRFRNSNSAAVAVITKLTRSHLTIGLYGAAGDKKSIAVFTSRPRYVPAGRKTIVDGNLAPGARKVVDPGASGVSVTVYRKIKGSDGKEVTEVVSRDRYPAQSSVVAVGRARKVSSARVSPAAVSRPAGGGAGALAD